MFKLFKKPEQVEIQIKTVGDYAQKAKHRAELSDLNLRWSRKLEEQEIAFRKELAAAKVLQTSHTEYLNEYARNLETENENLKAELQGRLL